MKKKPIKRPKKPMYKDRLPENCRNKKGCMKTSWESMELKKKSV